MRAWARRRIAPAVTGICSVTTARDLPSAAPRLRRCCAGTTDAHAHSELFDAIASRLQVARCARACSRRVYGEPNPVGDRRFARAARAGSCRLRRTRWRHKIVQGGRAELVDLLKSLVRLREARGERELPLVFAGGLFAENSLLSYLVETRLLADTSACCIRSNRHRCRFTGRSSWRAG